MDYENEQHTSTGNVLASLRALAPRYALRSREALALAERQATRLLELTSGYEAPVPGEIVTELPHVRIEYRDIPTSGLSYWTSNSWVICLNNTEPFTRHGICQPV